MSVAEVIKDVKDVKDVIRVGPSKRANLAANVCLAHQTVCHCVKVVVKSRSLEVYVFQQSEGSEIDNIEV